ncbi:MAG: hypothetical protein AB1571_01220 [Nanoarchaeota archaeon]
MVTKNENSDRINRILVVNGLTITSQSNDWYKNIGEYKLIYSIINKALEDYCLYYKNNGKDGYFNNACAWIFSNSTEPMSFKYICDFIDKDPLELRNKLILLCEKGRKKILRNLVNKNNLQRDVLEEGIPEDEL